MFQYIFTFIVGGIITTSIVYFESGGFPLLSRLAALVPVFTWLSYLFIGEISGPKEVSSHALFVLLGDNCGVDTLYAGYLFSCSANRFI